jgi:hypothetical protein
MIPCRPGIMGFKKTKPMGFIKSVKLFIKVMSF